MTNTISKTVSDETLDCIITIESAGNPFAKASTSSALGLFQFLDKTWLGTVSKHKPEVYAGTPRAELLAMRTKPAFCIEMGARFTEDNQRAIGMDCTGGDLYLAHFLGVGDAKDFYRADPGTPADKLVSPQVIAANRSIFIVNGQMQNAGQIRAWAARKMAKAGGHGWIKKYCPVATVIPMPKPKPEETADDIPDPQDAPAPPEQPAPAPEPEPAPAPAPEGSWLKRKWKSVTGAIGGLLGTGGVALFDWRIIALLLGFIIVVSLFMIFFMGPSDVRAWVRKQVT